MGAVEAAVDFEARTEVEEDSAMMETRRTSRTDWMRSRAAPSPDEAMAAETVAAVLAQGVAATAMLAGQEKHKSKRSRLATRTHQAVGWARS